MPKESRRTYLNSIVNKMSTEINYARQRASMSVETRKNNDAHEKKADGWDREVRVYKNTLDMQNTFLKELQLAKTKRQKQVKETIYAGFYNVKNIIPNASEVDLDIAPDAVRLVKIVKGVSLSICKRDGSAYNSMLAFYSHVNLLKMSKFENFMIMDEALSVVSANKSEEFSLYLPFLARGCVLVLIEQKDEIFIQSGDIVEYRFKKIDGITQIRRIS